MPINTQPINVARSFTWCRPPPLMQLLLLGLLFIRLVAGRGGDVCTLRTDEGTFYDLSSLSASKDYSIPAFSKGGSPLILNVCKAVTSETWGIDHPSKVGGFFRRAHGDFSIGQPNTTLSYNDDSLQLYMLGGSKCAGGSQASTIIDFICDTAVFGAGQPRLVAQLPPDDNEACSFFLEWRTHYACPTGSRSGPWGFFVSLIALGFVLLMLYLTLGTLYNRFVLNLSGFDQIPSFSLEAFRYHASEGLDWFKDIMSGLYEGGQGGRTTLPRTNPVSHQSGIDGGNPPAGAFVRPGRSEFPRPSGPPVPPTNPISHQSQVNASTAPPRPPEPQVQQSVAQPTPQKEEERPFLVGDDEDDAEELAPDKGTDQTVSPGAPAGPSPPKPSPSEDAAIRL